MGLRPGLVSPLPGRWLPKAHALSLTVAPKRACRKAWRPFAGRIRTPGSNRSWRISQTPKQQSRLPDDFHRLISWLTNLGVYEPKPFEQISDNARDYRDKLYERCAPVAPLPAGMKAAIWGRIIFILVHPMSSAEANQGASANRASAAKNEKTLPGLFAGDWLYYAIAAQDHSPAELRLLASKRLGCLVWKWGEAHSNREGLVFRFPSSTWSRQLRDDALHGQQTA